MKAKEFIEFIKTHKNESNEVILERLKIHYPKWCRIKGDLLDLIKTTKEYLPK